jgi:release factor glutamine methyltransferase
VTGPEALAEGARLLREAGVPDAAGDARRLLAHALGIAPGRLTVEMPSELKDDISDAYRHLLRQRMKRVPVSQLVGARTFWGRKFLVDSAVLDPRPETEILVATALEAPFSRVLDLGTGSGCILVSLLADRPDAAGLGVDLSDQALAVARRNAVRHDLGGRAEFVQSNWYAGLQGQFDLIVSNPPYIAADEMPGLEPEVRLWEPRMALTDEGDGLSAYRALLSGAPAHMIPGGRLLLEHGPGQSAAIAAIGAAHGFAAPEVRHDFDGRERICVFRAS